MDEHEPLLSERRGVVAESSSGPRELNSSSTDLIPDEDAISQKASHAIVRLSFIGVILYVATGVSVYWVSGSFKAKSTSKPVDAVYFTMVTLCTTGYGDIVPDTAITKVFTCGLILVGFGFVGVLLNRLVTYICDRHEEMLQSAVDENRVNRRVRSGRMKIRTKVCIALAVVVFCIAIGTIYARYYEKLDWLDSFYLSVASVTTVVYGDYAFTTKSGRCFASVWLLVSTFAAKAFLYLTEYSIDKRNHTTPRMSISKSEFRINKLKEMGKITENDIQQIDEQFDSLDSSQHVVEQ